LWGLRSGKARPTEKLPKGSSRAPGDPRLFGPDQVSPAAPAGAGLRRAGRGEGGVRRVGRGGARQRGSHQDLRRGGHLGGGDARRRAAGASFLCSPSGLPARRPPYPVLCSCHASTRRGPQVSVNLAASRVSEGGGAGRGSQDPSRGAPSLEGGSLPSLCAAVESPCGAQAGARGAGEQLPLRGARGARPGAGRGLCSSSPGPGPSPRPPLPMRGARESAASAASLAQPCPAWGRGRTAEAGSPGVGFPPLAGRDAPGPRRSLRACSRRPAGFRRLSTLCSALGSGSVTFAGQLVS
jgi:hypothetical protein